MQICREHTNEVCEHVKQENLQIATILILEEVSANIDHNEYKTAEDFAAVVDEEFDGCPVCFISGKVDVIHSAIHRLQYEVMVAS